MMDDDKFVWKFQAEKRLTKKFGKILHLLFFWIYFRKSELKKSENIST